MLPPPLLSQTPDCQELKIPALAAWENEGGAFERSLPDPSATQTGWAHSMKQRLNDEVERAAGSSTEKQR